MQLQKILGGRREDKQFLNLAFSPDIHQFTNSIFQILSFTMALDNPLDSSYLFQCVNILCIVAQQLSLLVQHRNEFVTGGRLELTRVDFL